jgi:ceramide glucosyltransferase
MYAVKPSVEQYSISSFTRIISVIGVVWWLVMLCIAYYGFFEIMSKFNREKYTPEISKSIEDELEGVTILRPIKGVETELEICLESCLTQKYPADKLQVIFCVESGDDPAVPIIRKLTEKYKDKDTLLLIDDELTDEANHFGPNPKINNLAKGYKRAKFDIIWVLDSNVYVNPGTLIRSTISLNNSLDNGSVTSREVKLIHHVPLAVSINSNNTAKNLGARLDEMFLLTSHAKFYVFFNKASVAPCVNGKSNIYRKSDLDYAVSKVSENKIHLINNRKNIAEEALKFTGPNDGLKFFARYIGEDNMIGIALWENDKGGRTGMTGDIAVQPIDANFKNGIWDYINRRVRWLRVRKYMVLMATLIEPTTESLVVGTFGSFGLSNLFFGGNYKLLLLLIHELIWCYTDYVQYDVLIKQSVKDSMYTDEPRPYFLDNYNQKLVFFKKWLPIWILREVLALPIWIIAMCGTEIDWRDRPFRIRSDLSAEEL